MRCHKLAWGYLESFSHERKLTQIGSYVIKECISIITMTQMTRLQYLSYTAGIDWHITDKFCIFLMHVKIYLLSYRNVACTCCLRLFIILMVIKTIMQRHICFVGGDCARITLQDKLVKVRLVWKYWNFKTYTNHLDDTLIYLHIALN